MATSLVPSWTPHTLEFLAAIGTVGAVVIAVLGGLIRSTWRALRERATRPNVELIFNQDMGLTMEARDMGPGLQKFPAAYVRLIVRNERGRRAAEGVEVHVTDVLPLRKAVALTSDSWREQRLWNLGPLGWTNTNPPELTLGPGASRTVDLGHTSDQDPCVFTLGMPIVPATRVDRLPAGLYQIELAVFGLNMDAQTWSLRLDYDGLWVGGRGGDERARESLQITDLHRLA